MVLEPLHLHLWMWYLESKNKRLIIKYFPSFSIFKSITSKQTSLKQSETSVGELECLTKMSLRKTPNVKLFPLNFYKVSSRLSVALQERVRWVEPVNLNATSLILLIRKSFSSRHILKDTIPKWDYVRDCNIVFLE